MELEVQLNMPAAILSVDAPQVTRANSNTDFEGVEQQLEPADHGTAAWRILFAVFMFEAILFGKYIISALLVATVHLLAWLQASRYHSVCSKTTTPSSRNSRVTRTFPLSAQWRLAYRISVAP